eukprot:jgi/Picsp_1/6068/NSC_03422-R1_protein
MAVSAFSSAITKIDEIIANLKSGSIVKKHNATNNAAAAETKDTAKKAVKQPGKKKEKKQNTAAAKSKKSGGEAKLNDIIYKANLVVARVEKAIPHPDSDKLIITQLNCGDHSRQIVAGLQKHVTLETFQGTHVVVIINLKTARLAGETSEGMILAASSPDDGMVSPISPPEGSQAGDMVYPVDLEPPEDGSQFPKTLKGDIWRSIVPKLKVIDGKATYDGKDFVTKVGRVCAPGFPDNSTIS